jgi:hypothetical protein
MRSLGTMLTGAGDGHTDARCQSCSATRRNWDQPVFLSHPARRRQLPVRGYLRMEPGRWRNYADLSRFRQSRSGARRGAPTAHRQGRPGRDTGKQCAGPPAWPSGDASALAGDWYLSATPISPVRWRLRGPAGRLLPTGQRQLERDVTRLRRLDSADRAERAAWGERRVVSGGESRNRREMTISVDGLCGWAFRGGSSEQAYRSVRRIVRELAARPVQTPPPARPGRCGPGGHQTGDR